jgi:hypothetical protein
MGEGAPLDPLQFHIFMYLSKASRLFFIDERIHLSAAFSHIMGRLTNLLVLLPTK